MLAQRWPARVPRPIVRREVATRPLLTGQRVIDTFFEQVVNEDTDALRYNDEGTPAPLSSTCTNSEFPSRAVLSATTPPLGVA